MSNEAERIALGNRLREAREYAGYSQDDVAKYIDAPRTAVVAIEKGTRGVDALELEKIADLFEVSVARLLGTEPPADVTPVDVVARAAKGLSPKDVEEVIRFAQFLKDRKRGQDARRKE